jgi:hypothetical protein
MARLELACRFNPAPLLRETFQSSSLESRGFQLKINTPNWLQLSGVFPHALPQCGFPERFVREADVVIREFILPFDFLRTFFAFNSPIHYGRKFGVCRMLPGHAQHPNKLLSGSPKTRPSAQHVSHAPFLQAMCFCQMGWLPTTPR